MKYFGTCLLALLFCILAMPRIAHAAFIPSSQLPELVQQADVICIGSTERIEEQGQSSFDTGSWNERGEPLKVMARKEVATFAVESVMKGDLGTKIQIVFPKSLDLAGSYYPFTQLVGAERSMVFLKKDDSANSYHLLSPANFPPAKVVLGGKGTGINASDEPSPGKPLRAVLHALTNELGVENATSQSECLNYIGQAGFVLYRPTDFTPSSAYSTAIANLRLALNEPNVQGTVQQDQSLETFVENVVLPKVHQLTQSRNAQVSLAANLALAALQNPEAVPAMAQLASNGQTQQAALIALRDYANPQALKPLTVLLDNEDASVRDAAAFSLRRINDPKALPFLIDSLRFGEQTSENVFLALNDLTRSSNNAVPMPGAKDQSLVFWRDWAAKYKAQLDALRLSKATTFQFNQSGTTPPVDIERPNALLVKNELAPNFAAADMNGKIRRLSDLRGKSNLLLTFFPKCFTGGCTNHLSSLRDNYTALQTENVEVWAVSVDPADGERGQLAFAKQWSLPFPLIPDTERKLSLLYKAAQKPTDIAQRMSVLVDKQGIVRYIDTNVQVMTHGTDMLAKIRELRLK